MLLLAGRTVSFLTTASMEVLPNHGRTVTGGVRPWRSFMTTGRTGWPPGMGKMLLFKLITSECISLSDKTVDIFCHEVICRNQPKCPIKTSADSEQFHLTLTLMCIWNIRPDTQIGYRYCPVAAQIDHLSKYLKEWMGFINLNFKECNFPRISSSCHKLRSESSTSVLSETFWRNGSIHLECRASVHNTISIQHDAEWWTLLAD